jgi:anti-anti-sigma factor
MAEFRVEVRHSGSSAVLELHGDISSAAEAELTAAYALAVTTEPRAVVLNFEDVDYMNSTGIALVVGLLAEAHKTDRAVFVCGLSDHFRHIFEITRLADLMSFYPDENAAVRGATGQVTPAPTPEPA